MMERLETGQTYYGTQEERDGNTGWVNGDIFWTTDTEELAQWLFGAWRVMGVTLADGPQKTPFGELRVSRPGNRADTEFIYNKQPDLIDEVTGGGATATWNSASRDVTLAIVNATNGTSGALYSYDVPYTPGNGQIIELTGTLDNAGIGGGEAFLFLRSKVTGSVVETTYAQSEWTESSEDDLDWSKSQIFIMDFQSLKVGRIRFGFNRAGQAVEVHQIHNDNLRATGYWQLPSLPFYWRIYNDATYTYAEMGYGDTDNAIGLRWRVAANASATMRAICATVKSENGVDVFAMPGFERSADRGTTALTVSTTLIPLLSIRPAATYGGVANRGLYVPERYTIQGDNALRLAVLYRPTLTGASWTAVDATNSGMEYDVSASAVSGGIVIASDYLATGTNQRQANQNLLGRTLLKLGRTGTSDILTLAAIRTGTSNSDTMASIGWKEIR